VNYTRRTLTRPAHFEGLGLHTGVPVRVTVNPGEDGIAFRYGTGRWAARPEFVTDTTRSTRLGEVGTIEHLMSALAGMEITDAEVEVSAPEMPGLDGSASGYVRGLAEAVLQDLGEAELPSLYRRVFLKEEDGTEIAIGKGTGHWRYVFTAGDRWPGVQAFELDALPQGYVDEIASARTFAFAEEVPMIIQMGLGQGLDDTSALILGIEGYKNESRFEDEPARHKLLDLCGDLYLAGVPLRFLNVVAERSGHRTNVKAAEMLAQAIRA